MKKKSFYLKSIFDGIIQGTIMVILASFIVSVYAASMKLETLLLISGICSIISISVLCLFVSKEQSNKKLLKFLFISFISFVVTVINSIVLLITLSSLNLSSPISLILPPIKDNDTGGVVLLILLLFYFLLTSILRLIAFIVLTTRNKNAKNKQGIA